MTPLAPCPSCGMAPPTGATHCPSCGQGLGSESLPEGTTVYQGRYVVGRVLGQGGFGITYEARHALLGHAVALKELFPEGARRQGIEVTYSDPGALAIARKSFLAEGQALAKLALPGVVRVIDAFEANDTAYLVMDLLQGEALAGRLARGPLTSTETAELAISLTMTLEGLHATGMLHRDLKPGNIFLPADGSSPILIDFGSAAAYTPGSAVRHQRLVTPGYAPLEQYAESALWGPPTDLYGLSATLYHALVGTPPPAAPDRLQGATLRPLPESVPRELTRAIMDGLAMRVAERPATAAAYRAMLTALSDASIMPNDARVAPDTPWWTALADMSPRTCLVCLVLLVAFMFRDIGACSAGADYVASGLVANFFRALYGIGF